MYYWDGNAWENTLLFIYWQHNLRRKTRAFSPGKSNQPTLIHASLAEWSTFQKAPRLTPKYETRLKRLARTIRSSVFAVNISDAEANKLECYPW
jgi:hypothetical protein